MSDDKPIVEIGETYLLPQGTTVHDITEAVARVTENKAPRGWWICFLPSVSLLGLMTAVMLAGAGWKLLALRGADRSADPTREDMPLSNPFALIPALKWGIVLSAVLVASAVAQQHFGDRGLFVTAAASGLADVDAVTLAVSRQSYEGTLPAAVAALAITIAVVSNTVVKGTMAVLMGRKGFGRPIVLVFALAIAVGVTTAVALRLQ